jgi:hypothetical protein
MNPSVLPRLRCLRTRPRDLTDRTVIDRPILTRHSRLVFTTHDRLMFTTRDRGVFTSHRRPMFTRVAF